MYSRLDLEKQIKKLYGIDDVTLLMKKQIEKFIRIDGMSYKEIARALTYFCVTKKKKPNLDMGLAIVPYVREGANRYFDELKHKRDEQKKDMKLKNSLSSRKIIICKHVLKRKKSKNKIDLTTITEREDNL